MAWALAMTGQNMEADLDSHGMSILMPHKIKYIVSTPHKSVNMLCPGFTFEFMALVNP